MGQTLELLLAPQRPLSPAFGTGVSSAPILCNAIHSCIYSPPLADNQVKEDITINKIYSTGLLHDISLTGPSAQQPVTQDYVHCSLLNPGKPQHRTPDLSWHISNMPGLRYSSRPIQHRLEYTRNPKPAATTCGGFIGKFIFEFGIHSKTNWLLYPNREHDLAAALSRA